MTWTIRLVNVASASMAMVRKEARKSISDAAIDGAARPRAPPRSLARPEARSPARPGRHAPLGPATRPPPSPPRPLAQRPATSA